MFKTLLTYFSCLACLRSLRSKRNRFEFGASEIGDCLEFGACDLEFNDQSAIPYPTSHIPDLTSHIMLSTDLWLLTAHRLLFTPCSP